MTVPDQTQNKLEEIQAKDPRAQIIQLSEILDIKVLYAPEWNMPKGI
jgi:hypothetical protein